MASLRERCRAPAREALRPYVGDPLDDNAADDAADDAAECAMRVAVHECVEVVFAAAEVPADTRVMLTRRIRALLDEGGSDG